MGTRTKLYFPWGHSQLPASTALAVHMLIVEWYRNKKNAILSVSYSPPFQ